MLYTNRSPREAQELLDRLGILAPHLLLNAARNDLEHEHTARSASKLSTRVWVRSQARHPSNGDARLTVDVCANHDDDSGCCDTCGRWADDRLAGPVEPLGFGRSKYGNGGYL